MARPEALSGRAPATLRPVLVAVATALMLGACAHAGTDGGFDTATLAPDATAPGKSAGPGDLAAATAHSAKEFGKNPRNLEAALAYAKNLKAMGEKRQALTVLQQAAIFHAGDRRLASEYGRLALDLDQVSLAKQLLERADDPTQPDWRVVLARGTVLAKEGRYKDAIPYYERAQTLAHDQPAVLNNLALAHAMSGEAEKAEGLMRRAAAAGGSPMVRQNLALVLGLRGKHEEAKQIASQDLTPEHAAANAEYMRRMVKLEARGAAPTPVAAVQPAALRPATLVAADAPTPDWATVVAAAEPQLAAPGSR
jgi:Flp pilus assembly protein TadD